MPAIDRRTFATIAGATLLARPLDAAIAGAAPRRDRRLLVFTKSSGYVHSIVAREADGRTLVDRTLAALGRQNGFDVLATKDGGVFSSSALADCDAFLFVTTGDLTVHGTDGEPPMTAAGKRALLDAVAGGKGFVGVHNAADTFHSPADGATDPYIAMLGGEFLAHGRPQRARVRVTDGGFPGMTGARELERMGEWYAFRNIASDIRPLLVLLTDGLDGDEYRRPPYPVAWTRRHGNGRVAYTALGHFDEEWADATFTGMLLGMVSWAFGDATDRRR